MHSETRIRQINLEATKPQITVTLTIGRNVGNKPMARKEWAAFQNQAQNILSFFQARSLERKLGTGEWNGIKEDSCSITGRFDPRDEPSKERVGYLQRWVADLAREFNQETIAFTWGSTVLISASKNEGE